MSPPRARHPHRHGATPSAWAARLRTTGESSSASWANTVSPLAGPPSWEHPPQPAPPGTMH
eukprot:61566-Prorocentrum_minimum.AAC.1